MLIVTFTSKVLIISKKMVRLQRGRLATVFSCVYVSVLRFLCFSFFFFFLLPAYVDFGEQKLLFCIIAVLFMYCSNTVHALKNIKNGSHGTFHIFKNYFATVFSVFSFQFSVSATISSIQTEPMSSIPFSIMFLKC